MAATHVNSGYEAAASLFCNDQRSLVLILCDRRAAQAANKVSF